MAMPRKDDAYLKSKFVQVFTPVDVVRFACSPDFHRIANPKKHLLQRDFPLLSIWYGHFGDYKHTQLTIAAPKFEQPMQERFGTLGTLIGTYPWPEAWRVLFAHAEFLE